MHRDLTSDWKMDVVLSSGVLEHVPDPVTFLRGHREDLGVGGHIIISTPDSAPSCTWATRAFAPR